MVGNSVLFSWLIGAFAPGAGNHYETALNAWLTGIAIFVALQVFVAYTLLCPATGSASRSIGTTVKIASVASILISEGVMVIGTINTSSDDKVAALCVLSAVLAPILGICNHFAVEKWFLRST